jgi:uncharacterized membrane protein
MADKKTHRLRNYFFAGALILLPIIITIKLLGILINLIGSFLTPAVEFFAEKVAGSTLALPQFLYTFLALLITIILILLTGILGTNMFGKRVLRVFDRLVLRIPIVKMIYSSAQLLFKSFGMPKAGAIKSVVLIEYPKKDTWALAFKTGEIHEKRVYEERQGMAAVFVPTTPNPTSGFFLLVPNDAVVVIDLPVEEAMKAIISGGILGIDKIGKYIPPTMNEGKRKEPPSTS